MYLNRKITILPNTCTMEQAEESVKSKYDIIYIQTDEIYEGCVTFKEIENSRAEGKLAIQRNSYRVIQGKDEIQKAEKIFKEKKNIRNIPVLDEKGKILYEYVRTIESKGYWENRYEKGGNSGSGSYNRLAMFKSEIINQFIKKHHVYSMIEWGCGDGNQLGLFEVDNYVGYDVSHKAIDICRQKYENESNKKFICYSGEKMNLDVLFDLSISLDVVYHLVEDDVFTTYMDNLFDSSSKFVCIYSCNEEEKPICSHVRKRIFTDYIEKSKKQWNLKEIIKNPFTYDNNFPNETSWSDFYFYEKL